MMPLEEIEAAIVEARRIHPTEDFVAAIGPLYTARAIERLEVVVRAIGVMLQHEADERRDRGPQGWAYLNATGHAFEMGDAPLNCRHCGLRREVHSK